MLDANHLGRSELGDGLCALRHGMLGQLSWQNETDGSLNLPGGDRRLLVVTSQIGGLRGDFLEDVVDKGVQNGHSLGADASVGVNLERTGSFEWQHVKRVIESLSC